MGQGILIEPDMQTKLSRIAESSAPVLLLGPTGAGKTALAHEIHARSQRARRRLVAVNCGALPGELVEAQLFGHMRDAFTGARADAEGLLAAANGGTLFLDEIGELPVNAQVKLLKAVEERTFQRVGGIRDEKSDFRLIAATNQDLNRLVSEGLFRQDLYFRIAGLVVHVPALRERRDIEAIAAKVVTQACPGDTTSAERILRTIRRLSEHPRAWPGNIRELERFVEQARIDLEDAERSTLERWSDRAPTNHGKLVRVQSPSSPSLDERERYAMLVRASLGEPGRRPKAGGSSDKARTLATRLLDVFPGALPKAQFKEVLEIRDDRTLRRNIDVLRGDGLIEDRGDAVVTVWPQATATLSRKEPEGWLPVGTGGLVRGRTGDQFRMEIRLRVPRRLVVAMATHRAGHVAVLRVLDEPHGADAEQPIVDEGGPIYVGFELEAPCGLEQVLVHLSPPDHRGVRRIQVADDEKSVLPRDSELEAIRREALAQWGEGWLVEFLILHYPTETSPP